MSTLLHQLIEAAAERDGKAEAVSCQGNARSYQELDSSIKQVAAGLQSLGLQPDDRVAVYLPKQHETVMALFASAAAGGIFVPVNPQLKARQVRHILADSGARFLVTSPDRTTFLASELEHCPDLQQLVLVDGHPDTASPVPLTTVPITTWQHLLDAGTLKPVSRTDQDTVAILYTSGSTGQAKGVMLSHRNLVVGAQSVAQYLKTGPRDRLLVVLPLSFDYGLSQLTTAFHSGACAVLLNYLLPRDVLSTVLKENITGIGAVPTLWKQLAALDWPPEAEDSLRYITTSGGVMPLATLKQLREKLPATQIFLMYGLTEAFRSTYLPPEELDRRPSSIGKAIPNVEIAVVHPDGTLCKVNEPGELVHAGPLVAQGYWRNPEKTRHHFRPAPACMGRPGELAVWSGDTVTRDEDGFLYFVGRQDEMIKTSGYRVSPTEVEDVIQESGLADEVAAFGVPHPLLGQAIVVVLSLKPELKPALKTGLNQEQVSVILDSCFDICKKQLPSFMVPQHIEVLDVLPKTPNGKIDRVTLSEERLDLFANVDK
jgi:acyl-CoA ligase (AMP-forming) (exosortase A-associated)